MKPPIIRFLIILIICIPFSCDKTESEETPALISVQANTTGITETSFIANWTVNSTDIKSISITVSLNETLSPVEKEVSVANTGNNNQLIDQMKGATRYYYRIVVELNDGSVKMSKVKVALTSYKTEELTILTSDGLNIAGKLKYLESEPGTKPGIVFMHELGVWVNNWKNADVVTNFISQGYACLVIDFRGHGQSDDFPLPNVEEIESYIYDVAEDLMASIEFMKAHEAVHAEKLALIGGSLGATLAVAGNGYEEVKASVSLSGGRLGINSIFQGVPITSAFFIAGENDITSTVNFPDEATQMYNNAVEPKRLKIILGSSGHGTNLLTPTLNQEIIDWINQNIDQ